MDASEFQVLSERTLKAKTRELSDFENWVVRISLGIGGEAGEIIDYVKKAIFHDHGLDTDILKDELGDLLWYISALCSITELDLGEVMRGNVTKLDERYPNGFSPEDSKNRKRD